MSRGTSPRHHKKLPLLTGIVFYLGFWLIGTCIVAGLGIAIGNSPRPEAMGWLLFSVGTAGAVATVNRWARILPAVFGTPALNGLIILADGHALNQPSVPFPRWQALILIAVTAAGAYSTAPFSHTPLTKADKAACFGIFGCFVAMLTCILLAVPHWEIPVCAALLISLGLTWIGRLNQHHPERL